jgi:hypothetical protein
MKKKILLSNKLKKRKSKVKVRNQMESMLDPSHYLISGSNRAI